MHIHGIYHAGIHFHTTGVMTPLLRRQAVPVSCAGGDHRLGTCRDNTGRLSCKPSFLPHDCPAFVVHTGILVGKLPRSLHRHVNRLKRDISEERLIVFGIRFNKLDCLIYKILRRIEIIWQCVRRAICIPVGLFIDGQVRTLLPVIRPGIRHSNSAVKSPR